jgi:hypothetical protein
MQGTTTNERELVKTSPVSMLLARLAHDGPLLSV